MGYTKASSCVSKGDPVSANYHAPRTTDYGMDVHESLHVHLGEDIDVFGDPDVVVELLSDALTRAQSELEKREIR